MFHRSGIFSLLLGLALIAAFPARSFAQAAVAGKAIEEGTNLLMRVFGREAAKDLTQLGGEAAVRQVLENASREGGDALVARTAQYGADYGIGALKVIDRSPAKVVGALDTLSPELRRSAIFAAQRDPQAVVNLIGQYGPSSLEIAARHPGIGVPLVQKLGQEGISAGRVLTTDQATLLARHADDIAAVSPAERSVFWDTFRQAPARTLDYLESHPQILRQGTKVMLAGTLVAGVYAMRHDLLGRANPVTGAGFLDRTRDQLASAFHGPLSLSLLVVAGALAVWSTIHLWKSARLARLRVKRAVADHAPVP